MNALSFAGTLLVLYACQTRGLHIFYDFTDPLNAIRAGSLSAQEFSTNIKSHFGNLTTSLELTGAFSPDCNITVECGTIMNDAIQILHDVKRELLELNVDLKTPSIFFQFRIEISALKSLKHRENKTRLNIPTSKPSAIFSFPDRTTCDDLQNVTTEQWRVLLNFSNWFSHYSGATVLTGIGYNEDLIGCERLYLAIRTSNHLLTLLSPGKTPGVVESFGLFRKRMDYLHARNIEFVKNDPHYEFVPQIIYSSTSQNLGDEYHRHLLEKYWKSYLNEEAGAISPMPFGRFEIPSYPANKIIPYIDAESCHSRNSIHSIPWYAPAALEILSKYFGTAVLTHAEWKELKSNATRSATNSIPDIQLDLFIDYTDWLEKTPENPKFIGCDYNWSKIEEELELDKTLLHPLQTIKVTTLIFPLILSPAAENFVNVNSRISKRMSSRRVIGCGFLGPFNNSTTSSVVAACIQLNGSLYTLQFYFKLESITKVTKENSQHFENVVRPKLEEMGKFRKEILVLHPQATVYFQLRFELQMNDNQSTALCNNEALSLNEYVEATVNWVAANGIPLIMGRAFDYNSHSKYQTWFSVLRPTLKSSDYFNPYFVLRNSPQILTDAEVEPCVKWTVDRSVINETYFHNEYLGSMLVSYKMRKDKPISRDEYKVLLQFILNRFDVILVHVNSENYEDFITAMNTLAAEGLIGPRKKFILSFVNLILPAEIDDLHDFYAFLNFTKKTLGSNTSFLKGVFFAWDEPSVSEELAANLTNRHTMAFKWGESLNLKMGYVYNTTTCQNIGLNATSQKHKLKEVDNLLKTVKCLLCIEKVFFSLKNIDNPKSLGKMFDKHLYVKKLLQDFYPHLDVYFMVYIEVQLTKTTMPDYLAVLSRFKKFAVAYNLTYLIVENFDREGYQTYGWWKVSNYSNLSLTSIYEEKYSAFTGSETWRPPLHIKPNQTTNTNQSTNTANDDKQNIILVLGVTTSVLVLMIVGLGLLFWYYKNKAPKYLSNEDANNFYNGKKGAEAELTSGDLEYLKFDNKFELPFSDVFIDPKDLLGRGNFGTVYKGLVKEEPVAIKRPNENCSATSFKSVLSEIKVLCYIGTHSNVVRFVGAYTKEIRKGVLYIASELCSNGSLDGLLRAKKRVISKMGGADNETIDTEEEETVYSHDLHRFAKEIASGMEYIVGKNVIHGDLSARNVLLDENFTCKIGDFGLSRKLYEYLEYVKQSQEPLPWKWMAYESLNNMHFSSKSDVWSYGVTLWEIYSLGRVPYGGLSWTTGFADDLKNGLRLQMPEYATEEIYKIMLSCWNLEADERSKFTEMVDFFKKLNSSQYTVLNLQ